ncbi:NAD(P)/FAD-dependent oxidoreductase [Luteimicrobium sp. NPDC057192]|uniref:NAD(P)/FAD-dependent oxidoreductase n=1 Tax=Luteimicrobium sp. NPDC057192 TaxID=3346042 RepID=UPI00362840A3
MTTTPSTTDPTTAHETWDAVVVGGGVAGLAAALMLGRARRRVLVLDAGAPRNRFTAHMHGVLGRDGTSPARLLADGRDEVASYGGAVRTAEVADARTDGSTVTVTTTDGSTHHARHLVVATGLRDELPAVDGLARFWGRGVAHCPYCDGYEVRDQRLVVLGTGPASVGQAQLIRQWSDRLTYVVHDAPAPTPEERAALEARGIVVEDGRAVRADGTAGPDGERLAALLLDDGRTLDVDAVFTAPEPRPGDDLLLRLGAERTAGGSGPGGTLPGAVPVDLLGRTTVPRVWAAGNVVAAYANVPVAIAAGTMAGAGVNHALVEEEVAAALASTGKATAAV